MPSRSRRIIAGAGLAAGLLVGSIGPAAAIPGEPDDSHCDRIERIEERALDRIDRIQAHIARTERIIERFEDRTDAVADAHPERADRWQRRIDRMTAKVERLEDRRDRVTARYDAIVAHCAEVPLDAQPEDQAPDAGTPSEPDVVAAL